MFALVDGCRKVQRKPSLDRYDNMSYRGDHVADIAGEMDFAADLFLGASNPTRAADKALLIALGVDGDIPISLIGNRADAVQARVAQWRAGLQSKGNRGSGTTGEQLLGLETGDAFVVAHASMARYTLDLLRYLRGPEFAKSVRVVVARQASEHLAGRRGRVILDHELYDLVDGDTYWRVIDVASAINSRRRPANDNHKIAARAA